VWIWIKNKQSSGYQIYKAEFHNLKFSLIWYVNFFIKNHYLCSSKKKDDLILKVAIYQLVAFDALSQSDVFLISFNKQLGL